MLVASLLALALQAAPDHRDGQAVAGWLREIGALGNITSGLPFFINDRATPAANTEWIFLGAEPQGVHLAYRQLGAAAMETVVVRVRHERFSAMTLESGEASLSRETVYDLRCRGDRQVRVSAITDFERRNLSGRSVRAKLAERPWTPVAQSLLAGHADALCEPMKPRR